MRKPFLHSYFCCCWLSFIHIIRKQCPNGWKLENYCYKPIRTMSRKPLILKERTVYGSMCMCMRQYGLNSYIGTRQTTGLIDFYFFFFFYIYIYVYAYPKQKNKFFSVARMVTLQKWNVFFYYFISFVLIINFVTSWIEKFALNSAWNEGTQ